MKSLSTGLPAFRYLFKKNKNMSMQSTGVLYACAHVCIAYIYIVTRGGCHMASSMFPVLTPLRQLLSLNLAFSVFQLSCWRLFVVCSHQHYYRPCPDPNMDVGDPNLGPHAYIETLVPTEPSPQSQIKKNCK